MKACLHMEDASWCALCNKRPNTEAKLGGMWAEALRESLTPVPQVTATIVPVPTTTRVEIVPRTRYGGHGGSLPRNEHPSQRVLVTRPDDTARLLAKLVEARPDWVRS